MTGWLLAVVTVISAVLGGGAVVALINAIANRRKNRVEVTDRLSDSALKWVQEFQEETQRARLEASEARREVAEVRRELADVRHQAEALAQDMRNLRGAILSPNATLDRLRAMVGGDSLNGR
jgi:predicted  nucleic acid-binding Zn-ribbon protein